MILASIQYGLWMLLSIMITILFFYMFQWGLLHFLQVWIVGRYSLIKPLQNNFDDACTALQHVLLYVFVFEDKKKMIWCQCI